MKTLSAIERPAVIRESAGLLEIADEIDVIVAAAQVLVTALDADEDTQYLGLNLQRSIHFPLREISKKLAAIRGEP